MLKETGCVIDCDGDYALVSVQRQSACSACSASKGCGTSLLAKLFRYPALNLRAINQAKARTGDRVEVVFAESAMLWLAFWTYLFPVLSMLLFALLGQFVIPAISEALTIVLAIAGLISGIVGGRRIMRRKLMSEAFQPVVDQIVL